MTAISKTSSCLQSIMVAIHKDNHFMIFILLSKEDSWKKYLE